MREYRTNIFIGIILVVITLAVFGQVINHEFTTYDDDVYVTENPVVQYGLSRVGLMWAATQFHASNWHPLTWLSHMTDVELFGLDAGKHHATSLLFHTANAILLFLVLVKLTGLPWRSGFVAALFAIHPLHVESVAWVAERKDVLSAFFMFLTTLAYMRYAERPDTRRQLVVMVLFGLGLMAKPMLVTLPLVLLLLDFWPLRRLRESKSPEDRIRLFDLFWEKLPLFGMSAMSCMLTMKAQTAGGAVTSVEFLPLSIRLSNAVVAYMGYILKMFWPVNLAMMYPHPEANIPGWQIIGSAASLLIISLLAAVYAKRRPYLAVGWLWFVITLIPVIGLVQVGDQAMADRYTYIPLIGLFIMAAWGLPELLGKRAKYLAVPAVVALALLMAGARTQAGYWSDSRTLYEHALRVTSNNYVAHVKLGVILARDGQHEQAIRQYEKALEIRPDGIQALNNLAVMYYEIGEYQRAWEYVDLCEEYGHAVNPRLLDLLSEEMPRED